MLVTLSAFTIVFYLLATLSQGLGLAGVSSRGKAGFWLCGFVAVLLHAYLLHHWIDIDWQQNLSAFNMLSLAIWLMALLILLISLSKPIENLSFIVFPLAIFSILLVYFFPAQNFINAAAAPDQLMHVLLAVLTFAVLSLAGLQAMLLAVQEKQMRQKHSGIQQFPPLEIMEGLLFKIIWFGFFLLTVLIGTSFYFFWGAITKAVVQKIVLVVIAWLIFGGLLFGRHFFGWRGRKAIYGTLLGVALLLIIYFGSILLLGVLI